MMRELWLWVVRWVRRWHARRRVRQRAMLPCVLVALALGAGGCDRPKEYIFVPVAPEAAPDSGGGPAQDTGPGGQNGHVEPRQK